MERDRPTPEEMLDRARAEEASRRRGKLRIFFGAAPGVGKTYAMLAAAQERMNDGQDVVIGWIETHGRHDTESMAAGLERIPPRQASHRGLPLQEFDLEAALTRRPAVLLVDELAHTNAPGSKHARRFQDVQELLDAGIDVYTTLNVQHLESVNDVVAQISRVFVRETVPDSIFDQADEVELVDITSDDLLKRLRDGKVYIPAQAERALENFFQKGNLIALRELALQRTAERVDAQMARWKRDEGITQPWPARERILVAIGPAPQSANLVRAGYRMATRLGAPWIVLWVETPGAHQMSAADRDRIQQHLALAEQLGAETLVVAGEQRGTTVLALARERNVSRILVGKPTHARWQDRLRGSFIEELIRGSGPIDVIATTGADEEPERPPARVQSRSRGSDYARAGAAVVVASALCLVARSFLELVDFAMVYLLAVLFVASRSSRGPALLASIASVAALDFLFVMPFYSFSVHDLRYIITFSVMLATAVLVSNLTVRIRSQAEAAREREQRISIIYALTRSFAARRSVDDIAETAAAHVEVLFEVDTAVLLSEGEGPLVARAGAQHAFVRDEREQSVARWVFDHGRPAGRSTDTLPAVLGLYLPLVGGTRTLGVLGMALGARATPLTASQRQILDVFVKQAALALERALLAEEAESARLAAETERLRNTLLATMSHDLRTPIAAITGAATSLLDESAALGAEERRSLLETVREEADRLHRILRDLLDLNRIESGALTVRKEWCPLEEIVGSALVRLEEGLAGREVEVKLPAPILLVPMDPVLMEQVLTNLLENAAKYTPAGSPITIAAKVAPEGVTMSVCDRGPGIPPADRERIFEKFYRLSSDGATPGTGLGLTICRAILMAHGGRIWVEGREGGGASFHCFLPVDEPAPSLENATG